MTVLWIVICVLFGTFCCLRDFCEKSHILCEDSQGNYSRHFEE